MLNNPVTARISEKVIGAPSLSDDHPATMRPKGAIHIAELARIPSCATERPKSRAMLGLNAAVANHIRKHQKNPEVARMNCSVLLVLRAFIVNYLERLYRILTETSEEYHNISAHH